MSEMLAQLKRWQDEIAALPEPVAYIVLDHSWGPGLPHVDGHDAKGKRYVICSPAVLDEVRHVKFGGIDIAADPFNVVVPLSGIPLYRREDMPEGWPDVS